MEREVDAPPTRGFDLTAVVGSYLYTVREAAELLNVPVTALYRAHGKGGVTMERGPWNGKTLYVRGSEILRAVEGFEVA